MMSVQTRRGGIATGPIPDFESVTWVEHVNTVTGGTITLPERSRSLRHLLSASTDVEPVGILIADPDTGRHVAGYMTEEEITGEGGSLSLPFRLDIGLINDVPAFPDPATPDTPWAVNSHWTRTDTAVACATIFLNSHSGPASHPDYRRFTQVSGQGSGPTVTFRARMEPSLEYIAEKVAGQAIIDTVITDQQTMVLEVRDPVARPNVVFSSELHTMHEWAYTNRQPAHNRWIAGGSGEGTARLVATSALPPTFWPRARATFLDRRQSDQAATQAAADDAATWDGPTVSIVATDGPTARYNRDFLLGDLVNVDIAGARLQLPATAVATTIDQAGVTRQITLGSANIAGRPDLDLRTALLRRFGLMEQP